MRSTAAGVGVRERVRPDDHDLLGEDLERREVDADVFVGHAHLDEASTTAERVDGALDGARVTAGFDGDVEAVSVGDLAGVGIRGFCAHPQRELAAQRVRLEDDDRTSAHVPSDGYREEPDAPRAVHGDA